MLEELEEIAALLVFVTVKAAATLQFYRLAARLVARQELDCIIVDKAHLTVTVSKYWQAMVNLALLWAVRTQFIYLTATLLLSLQGWFKEQNHLVRPRVVQALTNCRNLFYLV